MFALQAPSPSPKVPLVEYTTALTLIAVRTDLQVSHDTALEILREISSGVPLTRTLAQIIAAPSIRTGLLPVDRLLGVQPAVQDEDAVYDSVQILNICGSPGAGKERVALCTIRMMLNTPEAEVLVVGAPNLLLPLRLYSPHLMQTAKGNWGLL